MEVEFIEHFSKSSNCFSKLTYGNGTLESKISRIASKNGASGDISSALFQIGTSILANVCAL